MKKLFVITGASGAGKTTAVNNVEKMNPENISFCYFDSIGVPSTEEMNEKFGGPEAWQKMSTEVWIQKIITDYVSDEIVMLDGQIRLSFIIEICKNLAVENYEIVLFDCNDEVRKERLISRGHADLANDGMMGWATYLRKEANTLNAHIIDNSDLTQEESRDKLLGILTA